MIGLKKLGQLSMIFILLAYKTGWTKLILYEIKKYNYKKYNKGNIKEFHLEIVIF